MTDEKTISGLSGERRAAIRQQAFEDLGSLGSCSSGGFDTMNATPKARDDLRETLKDIFLPALPLLIAMAMLCVTLIVLAWWEIACGR